MTAINWKTGSSDYWGNAAAWSGGAVPGAGDTVTISAAALGAQPYTITILQATESVASVDQTQAASILLLNSGTLAVSGTYTMAAGVVLLRGGTLQGGTYAEAGGSIQLGSFATNIIDHVVSDGSMVLVAQNQNLLATVDLREVTFHGAGGIGTGTLSVGPLVGVGLGNAPVLDNIAVTLAGNDSLQQDSGIFTLGTHGSIGTSGQVQLGNSSYALVDNGAISATGSLASLDLHAVSFNGSGTLAASGGGRIAVYADTIADTGLVSVGAGSYLRLGALTGFASVGTLQVAAGGTLSLGFGLTTAQLAGYGIGAGTAGLSGVLDNTGAILAAGAGTPFTNIVLDGGTIDGGTVVGNANFSIVTAQYSGAGAGTLSGVTVIGGIALASANDTLLVTNGLIVNGVAGAPGSISITGANATMLFQGSETLDNVVITLGGAPAQYTPDSLQMVQGQGAGTLTLGAHSQVDAGQAGILAGVSGQDQIVNLGIITDAVRGGTLSLTTVVNRNLVNVSNGASLTLSDVANSGTIQSVGGIVSIDGAVNNTGLIAVSGIGAGLTTGGFQSSLDNTGVLSVSDGATADLGQYGTNWVNTGIFAVSGGELSVGGSLTVADLGTIALSGGGILGLNGTLANTGTLSVGAGATLSAFGLISGGVIAGGTVHDAGGGLLAQGGTLSGVTLDGVLSLAGAYAAATIVGGLTATGVNGSGAGSIALTGIGSLLTVQDSETLNNVAVSIGATGQGASLSAAYAQTLTLGTQAVVRQTGSLATLGSFGATMVNDGLILAGLPGATLQLKGAFTNAGTLAVSAGETLVLATAQLTNTGVISATNSVVDVVSLTTAELATVRLVNSRVFVTGTLDNTGGILAVGRGGTIPGLVVAGHVLGGVIHDAGAVSVVGSNAKLDGVTYQGTLLIDRPLATLTIDHGLTLTGLSGQGPGSVQLIGAGSSLVLDGTPALDNATVAIGNAGLTYQGHSVAAPAIVGTSFFPVILGPNLIVQQVNTYADVGGVETNSTVDFGRGTLTAGGSIRAGVAHGQLTLEGDSFTNAGSIAISASETVTAGAANFYNTGSIGIGVGSTLDLNLFNYFANGSLAAESLSNYGSIVLTGGTMAELTDNGVFPNVPLLNATGASIAGAGVVASQITNYGTIEAHGGVLNLVQAIAGVGALKVDAGATLVLGGVSNGQIASFSGVGGVLGLTPAAFLGAIGGFAAGDTLDLFTIKARSAAFSGHALVVTLSNGATIRLATTSALSGTLSVTAGVHGDSLIRFAGAAFGPPPLLAFWGDPAPAAAIGIPDHHAALSWDDGPHVSSGAQFGWMHQIHAV